MPTNSSYKKLLVVSMTASFCWGVISTWCGLKKFYKDKADKEIDDIRNLYETLSKVHKYIKPDDPKCDEEKNCEPPVENKPESRSSYHDVASIYIPVEEKTEEPSVSEDIYIISPKEFGEDGHEKAYLSYFTDKVLADDAGYIVSVTDDAPAHESHIPQEVIDNIGKYEEDIIHCRNDILNVDYEIVCDPRAYSNLFPSSAINYDD